MPRDDEDREVALMLADPDTDAYLADPRDLPQRPARAGRPTCPEPMRGVIRRPARRPTEAHR